MKKNIILVIILVLVLLLLSIIINLKSINSYNSDTTNSYNSDTANSYNSDTANSYNSDTANFYNSDTANFYNLNKAISLVHTFDTYPNILHIKDNKIIYLKDNQDDVAERMNISIRVLEDGIDRIIGEINDYFGSSNSVKILDNENILYHYTDGEYNKILQIKDNFDVKLISNELNYPPLSYIYILNNNNIILFCPNYNESENTYLYDIKCMNITDGTKKHLLTSKYNASLNNGEILSCINVFEGNIYTYMIMVQNNSKQYYIGKYNSKGELLYKINITKNMEEFLKMENNQLDTVNEIIITQDNYILKTINSRIILLEKENFNRVPLWDYLDSYAEGTILNSFQNANKKLQYIYSIKYNEPSNIYLIDLINNSSSIINLNNIKGDIKNIELYEKENKIFIISSFQNKYLLYEVSIKDLISIVK